jgi:hypothetical protein
MTNICITRQNSKFNRNIFYYKNSNYNMIEYVSGYGIYKYYFGMNTNIDLMIINASILSPEIESFIQEFHQKIKFIVYNDNDTKIFSDKYSNFIYKFLVHESLGLSNEIILPKHIINDKIFHSLDIKHKQKQYIYFLDNISSIPIQLEQILYPNTVEPIKMFNGNNIKHYQHLGHITEEVRKDLLLESSDYLYSNNDYLMEAKLCGCNLIDISGQSVDLNKTSDITTEYTTYGDILKVLVC